MFKKKHKTPAELVRAAKDTLVVFDKPGQPSKVMKKAVDEMSGILSQMYTVFYGEAGADPSQDQIVLLSNEILNTDLIQQWVTHIVQLDFEARKDLSLVFNHLLRRQIGSRAPTVEWVARNPKLLEDLVQGYTNPEIVLNCGAMIRDAIKYEPLCKLILNAPSFWNFFKFVESSNFDIASDAFTTFKDLLTVHKPMAAEFLEKNYEKFFWSYYDLLHSENYVTKRQSLKLLGELLLDRANFNVMTKFISSSTNLKLMMNLLRDKSKSIQFEAFHVFKVFVANPNKTATVKGILLQNRERLVKFLDAFHNDKEEDQFIDEKAFLIKQIQALE
jgi:calcium binding protein 39